MRAAAPQPLICEVPTLNPPVLRRALPAVVAVLALALVACSSAASVTPLPSGAEPPSDCARVADGVITFSAKNLKFSAPCLVANAGEAFTIHFTNEDSQPHDVAVYEDSTKARTIMDGDPIISTQGDSADYEVEALNTGQYYFDCTVHPADMNGTLYVVEP
jgi:plastocyanin